MKELISKILIGLVVMVLVSCGDSNVSSYTGHANSIPGERVALVFPWVVDGDEATKGTALFALYEDDGTYYVDFNGEGCRVKRITPIYTGGNILCYSFTTDWGGTYYLEDISDSSNRFFNL